MHSHTTEVSARPVRKRASKKTAVALLATCPVDGAGWCPYPFSPAQLKKRLERKLEEAAASSPKEVTSRKVRTRAVSAKSR